MIAADRSGPILHRACDAVLFDMDGTLVDSRAVVARVWHDWAARHGLDAEAILAVSHGRRSLDTVADFALPGMDLAAEAAALEAAEMGDTEGIVAIAGAQALLERLDPARWAVVTSASRDLATRRLRAAGLPLPALLITAESVTRGKPDPQGFLLGAQGLGVDPARCLIFEDAPAGIEAAQRAGGAVIAIRAARPHPMQAPCPEIEDYTEISITLR